MRFEGGVAAVFGRRGVYAILLVLAAALTATMVLLATPALSEEKLKGKDAARSKEERHARQVSAQYGESVRAEKTGRNARNAQDSDRTADATVGSTASEATEGRREPQQGTKQDDGPRSGAPASSQAQYNAGNDSDTNTDTGVGASQANDSDCPGAQEVETVSGTGNEQSPVFDITGGSFRLTITSDPTSQDPQGASVSVFVFPEGEDVDFVTVFDQEGEGTETSIVNAGPGSFFLDILAANTDFEITVDDCTDDAGNDGDNGDGPDGNTRDDVTAGPLPDTGGEAPPGFVTLPTAISLMLGGLVIGVAARRRAA